jgi:hypothetical protein
MLNPMRRLSRFKKSRTGKPALEDFAASHEACIVANGGCLTAMARRLLNAATKVCG